MAINRKQIKRLLEAHEFGGLFNQLGWDWPESDRAYPAQIGEELFELHPVARKRGFMALHCPTIPDASIRAKIESRVSRDIREHIIIFTDEETGKQRWQWVRRVPGQPLSRKEHEYLPSQPMLLIEKLYGLEIPMDEEEEIDLIKVLEKVRSSLDIDKVTKKFYDRFKKEHDAFFDFINGITEMGDQTWYASVMLNRLMFIYFIQKKGFLDGDTNYLRNRLESVQATKGEGQFHTFYRYFLMTLCHEVLAKKERTLDKDLEKLIGTVPYLNGGIFQPHELEEKYGEGISIPDEAFVKIFDFFDDFEWHLDNRPTANANEINPDVLGYIFEKYINQKQMGAYYTKEDITEYISKNTIIPCLFDKAQKACKIAFEGEAAVWNLLKEDPDRYIYPAVRHGITFDLQNDAPLKEEIPYPDEIETGLDTTKPDLLKRRKKWNTRTPEEAGLPTEIWRETVARRQRYADVRGKLERGEVQSINDLITLNLDIRQFAQDVIERCESPDLLNAFWTAIAGYVPTSGSNKKAVAAITVLDPTCGSGAFLFAALNILEPLYEACLERMKGFLEEWNVDDASSFVADAKSANRSGSTKLEASSTKQKHPNYAKFFQSIRDEIGKHPSPKYFIYKSIIIHNLYGVDIMKEATEICKLRLFLKLVAQVEDGKKIEPLPDIDFNIRAGNTLVGFATEEEMKRAMQGDLLAYQTVLPEILEQAEECDRLFNLFREAQLEGDGSLVKAKAKLTGKLDDLNARLNQYLAQDYGVSFKKSDLRSQTSDFSKFLKSHQPFHWFIEFYGIIKSGGFDTIIGNPPYVEYSKVRKEYKIKGYETENCGNIYTAIVERSFRLINKSSFVGLIVPLSLTCTTRTLAVRNVIKKGRCWVSSYDMRPSSLFEGVAQRLSILIGQKQNVDSEKLLYSGGYRRWSSDERNSLLSLSRYIRMDMDSIENSISKFDSEIEDVISQKIFAPPLEKYSRDIGEQIYVHRIVRYFVKSIDFLPEFTDAKGNPGKSDDYKAFCFDSGQQIQIAALLNSTLFYWFWRSHCDGFHCGYADVYSFPFLPVEDEKHRDQLVKLLKLLMEKLRETSKIKKIKTKSGHITYQEFSSTASKPIIDEIDVVLAEHYGFTDEELDYIINYDIKYRMGKDLLESVEE